MEELKIDEYGKGADWKSPEEMDTRDFVAGDVLGNPTDDDLNKAKSINLTKVLMETVNQGCVPSCTAVSLCHIVQIQNVLEHKDMTLFVDPKDQWINNQKRDWICSGAGAYLETALHTLLKNGVKGYTKGEEFRFNIDGYSFESWTSLPFDRMLNLIAFRLASLQEPLYVAFRGNNKISQEISLGEWKTIITMAEQTYGHAVALTGVDFEGGYVHFVNSWNRNSNNVGGQKLLSTFKISFDVFEQLIKNAIRGRRYFLVFDKKDMIDKPLFIDYAKGSEAEHTEAVRWAKETGIIKGVPSPMGPRLEPHRPMTRLEYIIAEYRKFQSDNK